MTRSRSSTLRTTAFAAACATIALALLPAFVRGKDATEPATSGKTPPSDKLIVHEWGTFTSFAGSDGVNLEFRPLVTNDLPRFVMNPYSQPGSPFGVLAKQSYVALQRMETPITYFYTATPRTVNVRVDFPAGMLSEWYPVVKRFHSGERDSGRDASDKGYVEQAIAGRAYLDWGPVRLTPPQEFANIRVRTADGKPLPASLPTVRPDNHYGQARETDSAIVETVDTNGGSHFEKFLFYRGLGNFELPIKFAALGNDRFEISNSADEVSGTLFLVSIDNDQVRFQQQAAISPNSAIEITLPTSESTVDQLARAMVTELITAGLYEKEAVAMVNTWRSSWFGENGTRLMYLLPGSLTDRLLPLTVDPAPDECVRVLVGRLETITPEDSHLLARTLAGSNGAEKPTAHQIQAELAGLGRFAEPAVQFVISQTNDPSMRKRLEAILTGIRNPK